MLTYLEQLEDEYAIFLKPKENWELLFDSNSENKIPSPTAPDDVWNTYIAKNQKKNAMKGHRFRILSTFKELDEACGGILATGEFARHPRSLVQTAQAAQVPNDSTDQPEAVDPPPPRVKRTDPKVTPNPKTQQTPPQSTKKKARSDDNDKSTGSGSRKRSARTPSPAELNSETSDGDGSDEGSRSSTQTKQGGRHKKRRKSYGRDIIENMEKATAAFITAVEQKTAAMEQETAAMKQKIAAMEQQTTSATSRIPTASKELIKEAIKKLQKEHNPESVDFEDVFKLFDLFVLNPLKASIFLVLKNGELQDLWLEHQVEDMRYIQVAAMEQQTTAAIGRNPRASEEAIEHIQEQYRDTDLRLEDGIRKYMFRAFEFFMLNPIKASVFLALDEGNLREAWLERYLEPGR